MKTIFTVALGLFFIVNINAQSPDAFKYQAVVRDASGNALTNNNTGVQIRILKTSATGTEAYKETHSVTSNDFGLINLEIGGGSNVVGVFEDIAWGTDSYFLEVGIDPTGGTSYSITGTTQLLSVPYALYAKNAGNVNDNFWFQTTNGIAYRDDDNPNVAVSDNPSAFGKFLASTTAADNQIPNLWAFTYDPNGFAYTRMTTNAGNSLDIGVNGPNVSDPNQAFIWYGSNFDLKFGVGNVERMRVRANTGNIDVTSSDVYIKDSSKGVIMKSPNGTCFRMTVTNAGAPNFTSVTCPD